MTYEEMHDRLIAAGIQKDFAALCLQFSQTHKIRHLGLWAFSWRWAGCLMLGVVIAAVWTGFIVGFSAAVAPGQLYGFPADLSIYWLGFWLAVALLFLIRPRVAGKTRLDFRRAKALSHIIQLAYDTRHDPSGQAHTMLATYARRLNSVEESAQLDELVTALYRRVQA